MLITKGRMGRTSIRNKKGGHHARRSFGSTRFREYPCFREGSGFESLPAVTECPGREAPPGPRRNVRLLLLRLFGLLRLFRLLRFLSHSILSRFNGLKRDTRDARRRASLAKSSSLIPADSQPPASCCHACVMALSTVVMRFAVFFVTPTSPLAATARQRYGEFRKAPAPPFINSKPRRRFHGGVESPLSGRAASCSRTTEERPWAGLA